MEKKRTVYLLPVGEFRDEELFESLLGYVCPERREKVRRCARQEDKVRSLGAGLLLQYARAEWERAGESDLTERERAGKETLREREHAGKWTLAERECAPAAGLVSPCQWRLVAPQQILESLPFQGDISFRYGKDGKPYIKDDSFFFSLSHSGDYVACGISGQEIGVDIQQEPSFDVDRLARRFLSAGEWEQVSQCEGRAEKSACFSRFWTRREAFGKLTGEGLRGGLAVNLEERLEELGVCCDYSAPAAGYAACACWYGAGRAENIVSERAEEKSWRG